MNLALKSGKIAAREAFIIPNSGLLLKSSLVKAKNIYPLPFKVQFQSHQKATSSRRIDAEMLTAFQIYAKCYLEIAINL